MTKTTDEIQINFDSLLKQGFAVIDVRFKDYEISEDAYKYVIIRVERDRESFYADMIKMYLGAEQEEKNIYSLWINILQHKLSMSKLLGRDISVKVAALDFIETGKA
jgi:hypothetical protein